jgi:hypothetical protein
MNQRQLFFIVIFMCFNVLQSFSQASNKSYQLIIEVPTFTVEKTLPYLLNQLSGTTGVKISEYCADQGWIVFDILEERFSVAQDPLVLLKELHIEGILKLGASKNQVEANCKGGLHVLDIKK